MSVTEFRFDSGAKLTPSEFTAALPTTVRAKGKVVGRCDTLSFPLPNATMLAKAELSIGGLANDISENFNCDDVNRSIASLHLELDVTCAPPGNGTSFHYTVKSRMPNIDDAQMQKLTEAAIADYRSGPWVFSISLN